MKKIRHRIIIDLTAEEIDSFVVRQRLQALGEVHTVSVKRMAQEHVCVQRLAVGLGKQDLETQFAQLRDLVANVHDSDLQDEIDFLATQIGASRSPKHIFP